MKTLDNTQNIESVSVFISGKVQGVGFRAATVRQAHQLKLGGWVRNLEDGRVEALIQGEHTQIDQMLSWFLHGPKKAIVNNVEHNLIQTERYYDSFAQI